MANSLLVNAILRNQFNGNQFRLVGSALTRREIAYIGGVIKNALSAGMTDQEVIEQVVTPYTQGHASKGTDDPIYRPSRRSEQLSAVPLFQDPKRKATALDVAGRSLLEPCVAAFYVLHEVAHQKGLTLYQVTVQFGADYIRKLTTSGKGKTAAYFGRRLRERGLLEHGILVLEKGNVDNPSNNRGLHAHMVVALSKEQVEPLRDALKKYGTHLNNAVQISDTYLRTTLYDELYQVEESKLGTLPVGAPSNHRHWLGTYRDVKDKRFLVRARFPIDLGLVDYMCKEILSNADRGRKFSIIGLSGHRAARQYLYEQGRRL